MMSDHVKEIIIFTGMARLQKVACKVSETKAPHLVLFLDIHANTTIDIISLDIGLGVLGTEVNIFHTQLEICTLVKL